MLSFICLALLLPLGVLSHPLTLVHETTSVSCVIADVNYPNPHETLTLLNRRAIAPPLGLSKRTFADLLVWCHEHRYSTGGMLLARQNPNCPAASGTNGSNQGAIGPASSASGSDGSGSSLNNGSGDGGSNGAAASSVSDPGSSSGTNAASSTSPSSGTSGANNGLSSSDPGSGSGSRTDTTFSGSSGSGTSGTNGVSSSGSGSSGSAPSGSGVASGANQATSGPGTTGSTTSGTNQSTSNPSSTSSPSPSLVASPAPTIPTLATATTASAILATTTSMSLPTTTTTTLATSAAMVTASVAACPPDVIDTLVSQLPDATPHSPHFLRLPHPRTGIASLFLVHEPVHNENEPDQKRVSKILEVQAVEPPNTRSWFNGDEVISDGKLLVMTPVDPLFLLIPILRAIKQLNGGIGSFRPAEDIFEDAARHMTESSMTSPSQDTSMHVRVEDIMKFGALECTKKAMKRLCDVKGKPFVPEITADITVFRYSSEKLTQELRKKAASLSTPPIVEMSRCLVRSLAKDALMEDKHEDLLELGRTKLACEMLGQYLPLDVQEALLATYELSKLDAHVKALAREQSLIVSENTVITKKSKAGATTVSEGAKKRKKDSKGSQGVEKLKKANVSGMSKLSTFFTKKAE
ncbi:hypothetical protein JVT61DRAFT_13825 [Boletus reticuloceps]|uniref:Ribonuclease H2 subunit B n=1 Tax=Boletus reticuloceps TaxID=495285 RepID=A0A8I2YVK6_9AGAM|nr:hypothetical protein JVT61DRAFT_13825 [Boletus reticuloceps]